MSIVHDPWKDPDPQPGDFDAVLAAVDPRNVVANGGNPNAKLTIVLGAEGEDAERLRQFATRRNSAPPK